MIRNKNIIFKGVILVYTNKMEDLSIDIVKVEGSIYDVNVIQNDEYIGPLIERGYEWDGWMRRDVRLYHKPGTDILDIGANIGYNSLIFSDYGPVYSFEPVYYEIVKLNAEQNQLRHPIYVAPCALSDEQKVTDMYIPSTRCQSNTHINYGGTSLYEHEGKYKGGPVVKVTCQKLDDVYTGVPSFIKIDVEGHELQVLKGSEKKIRSHKPTILIEIHGFSEDNEVHTFIKSMGYGEPEIRPEKMYLYKSES